MNTTIKYIAIGGGVAVVVYLAAKAMAPAQAATTPLAGVTNGLASLFGSIKSAWGGNKPTSQDGTSDDGTSDEDAESMTRLVSSMPGFEAGGSGSYAPSAWSSHGDAAISDGAGYGHLSGRTAAQPVTATPAQRALYGDSPGNMFSIRN